MIKNYFQLALRSIQRRKFYTVINLAGLSIASAFCILVYWYVKHEQSFDRFHSKVDQLYRLEVSDFFNQQKEKSAGFFSFLKKDEQPNTIVVPPILAGEMEKDLPEIEHAIRVLPGYEIKVRAGDQSFKEERNSAYVDKDFFSAFNFALVKGNASTVLAEKNNIVLSEKLAQKYFGKSNPVGKTIMLPNDDSTMFVVSGVAKDFPVNSSYQFDLIMPRIGTSDYNEEIKNGLNTSSDQLILQLKKGVDVFAFQKKLDAFGKQYYGTVLKEWAGQPGSEFKPENFHLSIRPFAEAHYTGSRGWGHYTDLTNIYQLASLAVIILLIACLNYILLTLTGTVSRSQEVGIRKTIGAARKEIILQFYIETQLLSLIAVIMGLVLSVIFLPVFNNLTGSDLRLEFFSFRTIATMLGVIAIALGMLAGIYPALVMSGLQPLNMMRKFSAYRLNPYLSKVLVITQFSICIILIISTLVINRQMRFINQKDLGFNKDQIVTLSNPYWFNELGATNRLKSRLADLAEKDPAIENFTSTFLGYNNMNNYLIGNKKTMVEAFDIDYSYFSFFKIPIIKGRNFSPDLVRDSAKIDLREDQHMQGASAARQAVVVNETLYNLLGHPPLNEINRELGGIIVGVCKDYYPDDLTKKISPAYHKIEKVYVGSFSFKIKAHQNIPQVMERMRENWNNLTNGEPFSYTFLDETFARSYDVYLRWMKTVTVSCVLAIIIACMGLFGLSGLTATARIKEIGIRKVLGASVSDLFLLLNKGTFVMALVSFIVAAPVAILVVNAWLQNFAYRIHADWSLFAIAGLISVVTATIAVSYHTVKTAMANPVKSLRTE